MNKTPAVRFIGFAEEWEQRKLGDVLSLLKDGTHGTHKDSDEGVFLLSAKNIKNGKVFIDENTDRRISKQEFDSIHSNFRLHENDVLLTIVGSIGEVAMLENPDIMTFQRSVAFLRPKDNLSSTFLKTELETDYFQKELSDRKSQSAQPGVYLGELEKIPFILPNVEEQNQIGSYFRNLDNLITLHQRKYEKLKNIKKSMLYKMFPQNGSKVPEIRFTGFTDDWEQRKLLEFGQATSGTSIESEFSEYGIYKVISIGSYSEDNVYRDQGIRAVRSDKTVNKILNKGDITMILNDKTASGNIIGRVLLIEESGVYVYNQRTERIEVDSSNYDSQFIYTMLNAPEIRDKIIKQSQGNTQIYVNWTTVSQTDYLVPQLSEQRKIGKYFLNLDNLITLHQRKLEKLKQLKQAMLHKMFV